MNYIRPPETTSNITNLTIAIAEQVGRAGLDSSLKSSPQLHRELRIRTIHSSLAIEGNSLSTEAVSAILDGKRVLGAPTDIREVENAQRAYALLPEICSGE